MGITVCVVVCRALRFLVVLAFRVLGLGAVPGMGAVAVGHGRRGAGRSGGSIGGWLGILSLVDRGGDCTIKHHARFKRETDRGRRGAWLGAAGLIAVSVCL